MTRSRLRTLHLDGREFTWKADVRAAEGPRRRAVRVRAWGAGAGKNGRALQADLVARPGLEPDAYPFPEAEDVRALIRCALDGGWEPATRGGTFLLGSASEVALPKFLIRE